MNLPCILYSEFYICRLNGLYFFILFGVKNITVFFEIKSRSYIFVVVNVKCLVMNNKVKGVLAVALIFSFTVPCFGNSSTIKRKKNKWNHSLEQKVSDSASNNLEVAKPFNF
jgi:hypothetical protein